MDDWLKSGHLCERSIGTSSKRRSLDPCNERYVTTCDDDNDYLMSTKNVIRPRKNTRKDEENQYDDKITTNDFLSMKWRLIKAENLDLQYAIVFNKTRADEIFDKLERDTTYFSGDLTRVFVFGKWHDVPRKTVSAC